jgi:hypothetical protein
VFNVSAGGRDRTHRPLLIPTRIRPCHRKVMKSFRASRRSRCHRARWGILGGNDGRHIRQLYRPHPHHRKGQYSHGQLNYKASRATRTHHLHEGETRVSCMQTDTEAQNRQKAICSCRRSRAASVNPSVYSNPHRFPSTQAGLLWFGKLQLLGADASI